MALDEALFERAHRWFVRRLRRVDPDCAARRVELAGIERRLGSLASLFAGRMIEISAAGDHGGIGRDRLFLPAAIDWAPTRDDNVDAYLLRTALGVAALERGLTADADDDAGARAVATLLAAPAILARAGQDWPGVTRLFDRLCRLRAERRPAVASPAAQALWALERLALGVDLAEALAPLPAAAREWLVGPATGDVDAARSAWRRLPRGRRERAFDLVFWGELVGDRNRGAAATAAAQPTAPESRDALPSGTEHRAPPPKRIEQIELNERETDSPLCHVLEKVKTAEEHQGGRRQVDGGDELDEHLEALSELDLRRVMRSRAPTASVYRADLVVDAPGIELADSAPLGEALRYDEWDERTRGYRRAWCSVYVGAPAPVDAETAARAVRAIRGRHVREIRRLRAEFEQVERRRELRRRQLQGADFDLDAIVDRHAALCAARVRGGRVDNQRLYVARRPRTNDLATLVLLDASLSTDSWVANRRVLDVARESIVVLGEVLREAPIQVAVAAFFSNARRDCRFQLAKSFDEGWSLGYRRLFGIRPTGYTRIGPALRHAASLLRATGCRKKLLLLVSDGKPTDYDRYEGRYGIADVRQALRESTRDGIATVALTIDTRTKSHLPRMFGEHGFRVLRHARELPAALARLHERVLA